MVVITFSGRTPEVFAMLPYLPPKLPLIAVTSHTHPSTCTLFDMRPESHSILLPAPIPVSEVQTFGVAAPTTSTTVALALTDALAIAVARRLHHDPSDVFQGYVRLPFPIFPTVIFASVSGRSEIPSFWVFLCFKEAGYFLRIAIANGNTTASRWSNWWSRSRAHCTTNYRHCPFDDYSKSIFLNNSRSTLL